VAAEGIFAEGIADEAVEAVEAFAHVDGVRGEEDTGGGGVRLRTTLHSPFAGYLNLCPSASGIELEVVQPSECR